MLFSLQPCPHTSFFRVLLVSLGLAATTGMAIGEPRRVIKAIVLGDLGAGKTTLACVIAHEAARIGADGPGKWVDS